MGDVRLIPGNRYIGNYRYGRMEEVEVGYFDCPMHCQSCQRIGKAFNTCHIHGKSEPEGTCEYFAGLLSNDLGPVTIVCRYPAIVIEP